MLSRLAVVAAGLSVAAPFFAHEPAPLDKDLQKVVSQGRGTAAGRAAWDRVAAAGPEVLPALLKAMDSPDIVAVNWLRTAFDHIVERDMKTSGGKNIDAEALLAFVKDGKRQGRARRLALEVVERLRPGTGTRLYPWWLDDPEFRFEAVAGTLAEAAKLLKAKDKKALATYRLAFDSARDIFQARAAAVGLGALGVQVSVAEHLGFLTDWYVIGPFDGGGQKGFHRAYPPEKQVDVEAALDGQSGKIRWKRYQAREPPPTSGGRHQALVNLPEALGDADDAVAFAYTAFTVAKAQAVEFRGAADDNFTVYVNGVRVFGFEEWRNGVRHDRHRFKVQLKEGKNTVLVKVCQSAAPNPEPNWEFFLRVVEDTGKGIGFTNALKK